MEGVLSGLGQGELPSFFLPLPPAQGDPFGHALTTSRANLLSHLLLKGPETNTCPAPHKSCPGNLPVLPPAPDQALL